MQKCNILVQFHLSLTHSTQPCPFAVATGDLSHCGDRICPAIPSNVKDGPFSIGRLTLLTPNMKVVKEQKLREKRFINQYELDCDDNFRVWNFGRRFAAALLLPQAASGAALKQLIGLLAE